MKSMIRLCRRLGITLSLATMRDIGYLYSEVYAYEILQEVTKSQERDGFEGLKSIGKHYRSTILEPCASMDGIDMLTNFLNRKPGNNAFIDALDLKRQ